MPSSIEYLDPTSPDTNNKLAIPTIATLNQRKVAFVNNGWRSFTKMGLQMEATLAERYGVAEMLTYPIPTAGPPESVLFDQIRNECDVAVVGLAN